MNCPSCNRANAAKRRYCGGCGTNLEPVCRQCSFANDAEDRFCGGCGCGMTHTVVAAPHIAVVIPTVAAKVPSELDGLFANQIAAVAAPSLPDAKISQDDVDRLFGGAP